jgi:hypothetical protein
MSHFRSGVRFLGLFQSRCCVLVARFMRPLAAMLRGGAMTLGCLLMLASGGSVCFHYVVFFVHDKYSFPTHGRTGIVLEAACGVPSHVEHKL